MATAILLELDQLADDLSGRAPAAGLLPVVGRPLVCHAAEPFRALGDVDRLVLCGPSVYRQHPAALDVVDDALLADGSLGDQLAILFEQYQDQDELLLFPTNAPLATPEMLERFLAHAPRDAAVTWAVVRHERAAATFADAGVQWDPQPFAGEQLVWTLLGCVRPALLSGQLDAIRRVFNNDVNRVEAVMALGMGLAIKLGAGRASLAELARKVGELLDAPCVLEISPDAELALRVRNRAEHHAARARLESH